MATPVTDALGLVEDAILAALASLSPAGAAWWATDPGVPDLPRRLALPSTDPQALSRYYLAHHQDGGGRRQAYLGSNGWQGLITIRVRSRDRAAARAGLALVVAAMQGLMVPAGYAIVARWERPLDLPSEQSVVRAGIWRVTLRRAALPVGGADGYILSTGDRLILSTGDRLGLGAAPTASSYVLSTGDQLTLSTGDRLTLGA